MNLLKIVEKIVIAKNELAEARLKLAHVEREIDFYVGELVNWLVTNGEVSRRAPRHVEELNAQLTNEDDIDAGIKG